MEKGSRSKRHVEKTLMESEKRYRLVVDNINDGLYTLDDNGRFTFVNKVIEKRSGIPFDKFLGLHYLDVVSPKDHKRVKTNFEKTMRGENVPPYELKYITSNGTLLCVEINTQPIYEQGQIVGLQGISRDMTERKRAEEALREAHRALEDRVKERTAELERINKQLKLELNSRMVAEENLKKSEGKYRELAELLPEPVFETDVEGNITYTNHIGLKRFGYSQEEFDDGLSAFIMIASEDRERLRKNIATIMQGKEVGPGEYLAQKKDGRKFPVIVHSSAILDDNKNAVGLRGLLVDITYQKRIEKTVLTCQQKLRSLTSELSFAEERIRRQTAVALHDTVGQTMAFAKMKLGALRKSNLDATLLESLDEIIELLSKTITDTRDLISELSPTVLYELGFAAAIEWLCQEMKKKHGLTVDFKDDKKIQSMDSDIRVFLYQTVRELLINVAKHAASHTAHVSISNASNKIQIEVSDDGIGFDHSEISLRDNTQEGFGLFSIRERLEPIGGRLTIRSEPGNGTTVIVTVPLKNESLE